MSNFLATFHSLTAGNQDRLLNMQLARMNEAAISAWNKDAEALLRMQTGKKKQRSQRFQTSSIESWRIGK